MVKYKTHFYWRERILEGIVQALENDEFKTDLAVSDLDTAYIRVQDPDTGENLKFRVTVTLMR